MIYFLILFALAISPFALYEFLKRRRRRRLLSTALTPSQTAEIARAVPLTRQLPPALRAKLDGKVSLFLDQVEFVGCEGLDVTEGMQLSIAAQACLLIIGSDMWYDNLRTVLIYPGAFKSRTQRHSGYVVQEQDTVRLGESWGHGRIVLSWQHSEQGAAEAHDGQNVVFHEFAHQIDDLSGQTNGVPVLADGQSFAEWENAILTAFTTHVSEVSKGHKTVLDAYGATAHEEFFAVAVELFFERPAALKADEPAVYKQLAKLFQLDPAAWPDAAV
ncbi:zinc-dependent peptidase [Lentibacter algarum]|uniref:M90 family metallopeptidase n=1 Tax=Lentibacter algarum TaxID=576131 RepID=UPI001C093FF0|nr:M90 family metallopeptidase [Lentibacter algarum]MBU2983510.1 zinc-dependent peptidase [Lentibacter algarum]